MNAPIRSPVPRDIRKEGVPSVLHKLIPRYKFLWNEIWYGDALDGLAVLPDKCIDLGFADPPFNIDLQNNVNAGKTYESTKSSRKIYYDDHLDDACYEDLCKAWLPELVRVCKKAIVYCGEINLRLFYRISEPIEEIVYYDGGSTVITSASWAGRFKPMLVYADEKNSFLGRPKGKNCKFQSSVIVKERDYFDDSEKEDRDVLVHPCPIDRELIYKILAQMKPKSFLDPFVGSGTTVYIAQKIGIPWIAFEKKEDYRHDHDYLLGKATSLKRKTRAY